MKQKLINLKNKAAFYGRPVAGAAAAMLICSGAIGASAAADASGFLTQIIQLIAVGIAGLGVVYGILGVVHYASAKNDGDGPAQSKASGQIGAGVMVLIVSIALGASASTLAGYIS